MPLAACVGKTEGKRKATDDRGASNKKQTARIRLVVKQKGAVLDLVDKKIALAGSSTVLCPRRDVWSITENIVE